MLVDGKWMAKWQPVQTTDAKGGYVRQISSFRHWITPDGVAGPTGEDGFLRPRLDAITCTSR
jgi:putative glutathione S-transferase